MRKYDNFNYQTNKKIKCLFCADGVPHTLKRQYRACKIGECKVKYRVDICEKINSGVISISDCVHNHPLEESYDNANGMDSKYKAIIDEIMLQNKDMYPKQILSYIINNKPRFKLTTVEVLPELKQVQGYVHRQREKEHPQNKKCSDVESYITANLLFPTIEKNQPFFSIVRCHSRGQQSMVTVRRAQ